MIYKWEGVKVISWKMPHQITKQYEIESQINHNKTYVSPSCISKKKSEAAQIRTLFWRNLKNGFIIIP